VGEADWSFNASGTQGFSGGSDIVDDEVDGEKSEDGVKTERRRRGREVGREWK
jgi:hypothetical protein